MLIDTHAHLDDPQLAAEVPAILERARAAGVEHVITVATSAASSDACLALAERHPELAATAGIHPNHVAQAGPDDWDHVLSLVQAGRVAALGETGLDRHWHDTPFPQQEEYFARTSSWAERKTCRWLSIAARRTPTCCAVLRRASMPTAPSAA